MQAFLHDFYTMTLWNYPNPSRMQEFFYTNFTQDGANIGSGHVKRNTKSDSGKDKSALSPQPSTIGTRLWYRYGNKHTVHRLRLKLKI